MENCTWSPGASSTDLEIWLLFSLDTPPTCLSFSPFVNTGHLYKLMRSFLFGVVSTFRPHSFYPSFLNYDTPTRDFASPTTIPCRQVVRSPHRWGCFPCPSAVHNLLNSKAPRRSDSVPWQYRVSCPGRSTTHSSLPKLWLGVRSDIVMDSYAPDDTFVLSLTQHSKIFLGFLTRMSPVYHHPLILNP